MRFLPQLVIVVLIWLVLLGTFVSPDLRTYSTQLISLLLLFYIVVKHIDDRNQKKERKHARHDEDTLLFLTTYLKPKLTSLIDLTSHEENIDVLRKQLELTENEVTRFLEDKEKELEK